MTAETIVMDALMYNIFNFLEVSMLDFTADTCAKRMIEMYVNAINAMHVPINTPYDAYTGVRIAACSTLNGVHRTSLIVV